MLKPTSHKTNVDMVPLIDVVCLLLIFLIVVGDSATICRDVPMKLPRADQAIRMRSENMLVVQLREQHGRYEAVINNRAYALAPDNALGEYLDKQVAYSLAKGYATKNADGAVSSPVRLRIPEDCPMNEAEKLVLTMAQVGLVNIQYAAAND